jgi:hypothetical protein
MLPTSCAPAAVYVGENFLFFWDRLGCKKKELAILAVKGRCNSSLDRRMLKPLSEITPSKLSSIWRQACKSPRHLKTLSPAAV